MCIVFKREYNKAKEKTNAVASNFLQRFVQKTMRQTTISTVIFFFTFTLHENATPALYPLNVWLISHEVKE